MFEFAVMFEVAFIFEVVFIIEVIFNSNKMKTDNHTNKDDLKWQPTITFWIYLGSGRLRTVN